MRGIVLADMHVDPMYQPTASPVDGCFCRASCSNTSLLWSGHAVRPFGQAECAAPNGLFEHMLASAAQREPSPDFVFLLGDAIAQAHGDDSTGTARALRAREENYAAVTSRIAKAFPSAVTSSHGLGCAVALGNNDVHTIGLNDSLASTVGLNDASRYAWQAAAVAAMCGLSDEQAASFRRGGFYARGAPGGARLAVLNTAPYNAAPQYGTPLNATLHPDPLGQFAWLEAELTHAAARRTPLLILGHMPPVLDFVDRAPIWQEAYAARYWELLGRHSKAVAGQFFGHSHKSQFRVWGGVPAEEQAPLLVMGSVSPIYGNNPGFAVVTLGEGGGGGGDGGGGGGDGGAVVDLRPSEIRAYYADLAGAKDAQPPRVELLYSTAARLQCCAPPNVTSCCTPPAHSGASPRPSAAARRLTNARYDQWAESMADDPAPTAAGEAAWRHFHSDLDARAEPVAPRHRRKDPAAGEGGNCSAPQAFGQGCRVCTGGCRAAWLCLLRRGLSSKSYGACIADAVADEERAEAHLLATKAKASLAIQTPYVARHSRTSHASHEAKRRAAVEEGLWRHEQMVAKVRREDECEAKRKAAMEEELWRHEQMVARVGEEALREEQAAFARTLTSELAHVPVDASPAAVPESPGGAASPRVTSSRPASVLSPAGLN